MAGQLLDAQAADRPRDHQLLDLLSALEDVHGLPKASDHFTRVRDLRFRPPQSGCYTRFRRVLVPGLVPTINVTRVNRGQPNGYQPVTGTRTSPPRLGGSRCALARSGGLKWSVRTIASCDPRRSCSPRTTPSGGRHAGRIRWTQYRPCRRGSTEVRVSVCVSLVASTGREGDSLADGDDVVGRSASAGRVAIACKRRRDWREHH